MHARSFGTEVPQDDAPGKLTVSNWGSLLMEWRTGVPPVSLRRRTRTPVFHHTPTGNGLVWVSELSDSPEKRPCNNDINPVYQYPSTNRTRKGTVM